MRIELHTFQKIALVKLRKCLVNAVQSYYKTNVPQIISYQAPTGAGKTIIADALIETILSGDEDYMEQPNAVFLWLSDSPQLNEQSRNKLEIFSERLRGKCVTITEDSFDREVLDDGYVYFLNTQKLSKTSKLGIKSDGRQYTIWETLANTALRKADHFYFIIDEAHRGAHASKDMAKANSIMQKFLKGSAENGLPPMPVVFGMSATAERFKALAEGIGTSTVTTCETKPVDVRSSGLLKDRIILTYPETIGNDMAVLQAAAEEWQDKCVHWAQYCREQKYSQVNPVFVIQVMNGNKSCVSTTDLDECLRSVEEKTGLRFNEGEVVHAFGEGTPAMQINGLTVPYCEPSRINDDRKIKIVFFKETLSTGWDCPRAEAMMSFRHVNDHTYIAQLLGRMIRTPKASRILVDDSLNDVHLFLPQFNEDNVLDVVAALNDEEGASIPAEIESEQIGNGKTVELGLNPTYEARPKPGPKQISVPKPMPGQGSIFDQDGNDYNDSYLGQGSPTYNTSTPDTSNTASGTTGFGNNTITSQAGNTKTDGTQGQPNPQKTSTVLEPSSQTNPVSVQPVTNPTEQPVPGSAIDRRGIVKAVNQMGLLTYKVRDTKVYDYLRSLFTLVSFSYRMRFDLDIKQTVQSDITKLIRNYIDRLKMKGEYDSLSNQVMQFKLSSQIFDPFGKNLSIDGPTDLYTTTDADIDRQFRLAETQLGNENAGKTYVDTYYDYEDVISLKIDVILFAADPKCMESLHDYAKEKFHELNDEFRHKSALLPEKDKNVYDSIVSNGDIVSKHSFRMPETINMHPEKDGKEYFNHLYVEKYGSAIIKLDGWEAAVIEEEANQDDFVCWIRNPSRAPWALSIPYEEDGHKKAMYPDFLVITKIDEEYVVHILEPHNPALADNLGKVKGLAEYARQNPGTGRIELIRMKKDPTGNERPYHLDLSKSSVRTDVLQCASITELNHIFDRMGKFKFNT